MMCSRIFPALKKTVIASLCSSIRGYCFKIFKITFYESVLSNILSNSTEEIAPEMTR